MAAASPLGALPQWTNPRVTLYHGTVQAYAPSLQAGIDLSRGRRRTDFGQGFYTTTWLEQAQLRAWPLSLRQGGTLVVLQFDVDREAVATLDCLWFVRGGLAVIDFWSFVHHRRDGGGPATDGAPTRGGMTSWLVRWSPPRSSD